MTQSRGAKLDQIKRRAQAPLCTDLPRLSNRQTLPLDRASLPALESALGFKLPDAIVDLYAEVGNGGFGPGYGLMALEPTEKRAFAGNAVAVYHFLKEARQGDDKDPIDPCLNWPVGLLPIVHMGSSVYYCVDCTSESLPVFSYDCDGGDEEAEQPVQDIMLPTGLGLFEWLALWASRPPPFRLPS